MITTKNFIEYSVKDNMKVIRSAINRGESVEKESKELLTKQQAIEDVNYFNFVLENGYSGFSYYNKSQFDRAYSSIIDSIQKHVSNEIKVSEMLDEIKRAYGFILDGHLAVTCGSNGVGFYKAKRTYVSDLTLYEEEGKYYTSLKEKVHFDQKRVRVFPSLKNGRKCFLIGSRSYNVLEQISISINEEAKTIPVHRIESESPSDQVQAMVYKDNNLIVIKSSTFVGDKKEDIDRIYQIGVECRKYKHVVWNLSNNMGGNGIFAKEFLRGLNGKINVSYECYQLQSNLVIAKEYGEIRDVKHSLIPINEFQSKEQDALFENHLHIIINDSMASSAELALVFAQGIKNKTLYGANTLGIGKFGDLLVYYLPNSKSLIWCPHKVFLIGIEESIGVEPDIWIDDKDILGRVIAEINIE